jgi:hypothetical protein
MIEIVEYRKEWSVACLGVPELPERAAPFAGEPVRPALLPVEHR